MHQALTQITERVIKRSASTRAAYLKRLDAAAAAGPVRTALSCSNLAHGFAACGMQDKERLSGDATCNLGIITAYNDMLSAHQPYERYPEILRQAARNAGATAQVASGTPAMCDGVTQGQSGMELSLFSRDVIALSTAVGLSHAMFDGALMLGICDKIVPGLLMGGLAFGHLPIIFVPGGPMPSGLPNKEKAKVRQEFAAGKATRIQLLEAESASYHSPGTCTFYGTANSNQMFMEVMGLHLPGSTFVNPADPRRDLLTAAAAVKAAELATVKDPATSLGRIIDERALINALVGLLATGGSTNHTIHLVAIGRAAGIIIDWSDFEELSSCIPLLAQVYPNGQADVNHFRDAGGLAFIIRELVGAGLMHDDVNTICGRGLTANYLVEPQLADDTLNYTATSETSGDTDVLRPANEPFSATGGLRLLQGNLGRAIIKVSAVPPENRVICAPAIVCDNQHELSDRLAAGLDQDMVAVVRHQGVRANGMPELHKLSPNLAILQDRGRKVALLTDGRMSGASGTIPAAIHVSPEAHAGGPISKLQEGDMITVDCETGVIAVDLSDAELANRPAATVTADDYGCGRELFGTFRALATSPEEGALSIGTNLTP